MTRRASICLVILALAILWPRLPAAGSPEMAPTGCHDLTGRLAVLEDPAGRLSIEEAASPAFGDKYTPLRGTAMIPSNPDSTYWIRLSPPPLIAQKTDNHNRPLVLMVAWPFLSKADLFIPEKSGWKIMQAGLDAPLERPRLLNLAFQLPPNFQTSTCYFRLKNDGPMIVPFQLCGEKAFQRHTYFLLLAKGLFYGVVLSMVIYNLTICLSLRQAAYLWYVLTGFSLAMYFLGFDGIAYELAPRLDDILDGRKFTLFWMGLSFVMAGCFLRSFLQTRVNIPKGDIVLLGFILLGLTFVLAVHFIDAVRAQRFAYTMGLMMVIMFVALSAVCWRRGVNQAGYLLLAASFPSAGGLVFILTFSGRIPFSYIGFNSLQLGQALEVLLISLALAARVRSLKQEKDTFQQGQIFFEELSKIDEMTGLYNKRHMMQCLAEAGGQASDNGRVISLAILDVDKFKNFNDTYGHPEGDRVLVELARTFQSCLRKDDVACRYGGEEFALILFDTMLPHAGSVVDRVRNLFAQIEFEPTPGRKVHVTVSAGVAQLRPGERIENLIERADRALYLAKKEGRNQTIADEK